MENIFPIHDILVSRKEKEHALQQRGAVIWLTGLSGSGKSTIAISLERKLFDKGHLIQVLDGDNIRAGINKNLSFSLPDRDENIRRIAEIAKLFCQSGIICICSFISPTFEIRHRAKSIIGQEDYNEVYVKATLDTCERRDVKGLYKKARAGEIKGFTGIDSPYEIPSDPKLVLDTTRLSVDESVETLYQYLIDNKIINTQSKLKK